MSAILKAQNLAYISAPKCACTSIKELIFTIENNCNFNEIRTDRGAIYFQINGKDHYIHQFYPSIPYAEQPHHILNKLHNFCVVRDPLDRLVSCYRNRVLRHGALRPEKIAGLDIDAPSNPNLNQFVEHLDQYIKAPQIHHHTLPLTHFLGKRADGYQRIFNLRTIEQLPGYLKEYFGRTRSLPHLQTSQTENKLETSINFLSPESVKHLKNRYSDDFQYFGKYF